MGRATGRLFAGAALVVAALIAALFAPRAAYAEVASGTCGTCAWSIDDDGVLTIGEGTLASNSNYDPYFWPWHAHCSRISSVVFDGDVVGEGSLSHLFYGCQNMESIDLSTLDTSEVTNLGSFFDECWSLTSVDLSGLDTSNVVGKVAPYTNSGGTVYLGGLSNMFRQCSSLVGLDVSTLDTSRVASMGGMFEGCARLAEIDVSSFDTSSVRNMGCMFAGCVSLRSLDLSSFDTSAVTNMGEMFRGCTKLSSLDLSGWDVSSVTYLPFIFAECPSLTALDLRSWNTVSIIEQNYAYTASSRYSMTYKGWESMYDGCEHLAQWHIGEGYVIKSEDMVPTPYLSSSGKWWSQDSQAWYAVDEIMSSRAGISDIYTVSDAVVRDLANARVYIDGVDASEGYSHTPKRQSEYPFVPDIEVKAVDADGNEVLLVEGRDYTLDIEGNDGPGRVDVKVRGTGDWSGGKTVAFDLVDRFLIGRDSNSYMHTRDTSYKNMEGEYKRLTRSGFVGVTGHMVDQEYYIDLIAGASGGAMSRIRKEAASTDWHGVCAGIARSMAMAYRGAVPVGDLSDAGASTYYGLPLPCEDARLLNNIHYLYLTQFLGELGSGVVSSAYARSLWGLGSSGSLLEMGSLSDTLETIVENRDVMVLGVKYLVGSGLLDTVFAGTEGHEVVLTGKVTETEEEYEVEYYNENSFFADEDSTEAGGYDKMVVDKDLSTFSIGKADGSNYIVLQLIDPMLVKRPLASSGMTTLSEGAGGQPLRSGNVAATLALGLGGAWQVEVDGKTLSWDGSQLDGDLELESFDVVGEGAGTQLQLGLPSIPSAVKVACPGCPADVSLWDEGGFASVQADSLEEAVLRFGDGVDVTCDGAFEVAVSTTGEVDDRGVGLVRFSGTCDGTTHVSPSSDGALISSDSDVDGLVSGLFVGCEVRDTSLGDMAPGFVEEATYESARPFFADADPSDGANHGAEVEWMGRSGISEGWAVPGGREFRGLQSVRRCDFAAFLYRMADLSDDGARNDSPKLTDAEVAEVLAGVSDCTPGGTSHAMEVAWMMRYGISRGWQDKGKTTVSFRPMANVARQDMAAFLYRFADLVDDGEQDQSLTAGPESVAFSDVRHGDAANHAGEVEWLASVGVTKGWKVGDGAYQFRGTRTVARQDMAAFMYRLNRYLN